MNSPESALGIEYIAATQDFVEAIIPITPAICTKGILQSGVMSTLLETVIFHGAALSIDTKTESILDVDTHIRHFQSTGVDSIKVIAKLTANEDNALSWEAAAYDATGSTMSEGRITIRLDK